MGSSQAWGVTELEQAPASKIDRLAIKLEKQHPVIFKKRPGAEMTTEQKRSLLIAYFVSLGADIDALHS